MPGLASQQLMLPGIRLLVALAVAHLQQPLQHLPGTSKPFLPARGSASSATMSTTLSGRLATDSRDSVAYLVRQWITGRWELLPPQMVQHLQSVLRRQMVQEGNH